jgi:phage shock protein C
MKRLYRSRTNKVIAGICGGIGEYLETDPVLIRLIAVLFLFTGGAAFIAYILGIFVIPRRPWDGAPSPAAASSEGAESRSHAGTLIIGIILIVFGVNFLLRDIPFFHSYYWWFWDLGWHFFWPSILIAVGLLVLLRGFRK